jgi:predicted  nucleic acid-binding Zn-ribbon protein
MFDFYLSYSDGKTDSLPDINIPFISQISFHIEQKKKEYTDLKLYKKRLKEDIQKLEAQKNRLSYSLSQIKQEEKEVLSYLPFFHNLEKKIEEYHDINLKDDILGFSQVIDDFKQHRFNAGEIINEYLKPRSLKLDIATKEAHIRVLSEQKASLHNSILSLESQVSSVTQTMSIYHELEGMKFGLKELKQLWYKIREIADANKILHKEVVPKFLKDIEEQYDDKLGFESKIIEKKEELAQLKNKINNNLLMYRLEPSIGLTLSNLFQVGITERDIIGISQVVELCTNNTDSSTVSSPNYQNKNKNNTMEGGKKRLERWKSLIDDLKSYGEIKSVLKEQHVKKEMIKKEIDELDTKKQEISIQCQNGISFLNEINNKMFYFKGLIGHYNKDLDNKIKTSSRITVPSPIFIIYNNTRKEKDDGNETK